MKQIHPVFDDHDYEQLMLLAKLNKIKVTELARRIIKAHLDRNRPRLREEQADGNYGA
jgi:hypothetical protein